MNEVAQEAAPRNHDSVSVDIRAGTRIGSLAFSSSLDPVDVRLLVGHALGLSHVQLVIQSEQILNEEEARLVSMLLNRRLKGEPVAYITGEREFYGLPLTMTPDVLIPRPETELLVELAVANLPENGRMLDLGTGSGAIAIAVAHERQDVSVVATDVSAAAIDVTRMNAQQNLFKEKQLSLYCGSWFEALPEPLFFDLIVSNPPYIAKGDRHLAQGDLRFEPVNALTDDADGLSAYRILTSVSPQWLKPGGWLLMEHGYDQADSVRSMLRSMGFVSIQSWTDLAGIERVSGGVFP